LKIVCPLKNNAVTFFLQFFSLHTHTSNAMAPKKSKSVVKKVTKKRPSSDVIREESSHSRERSVAKKPRTVAKEPQAVVVAKEPQEVVVAKESDMPTSTKDPSSITDETSKNDQSSKVQTKQVPIRTCGSKKKTIVDRLKEYPNAGLENVKGILRCRACNKNIQLKSDRISHHVRGSKHKEKLETLENSTKDSHSILEYVKAAHAADEKKRVDQRTDAFRLELVQQFLKAGIPVNKIDTLLPYLEKISGVSLLHSSGCSRLVTQLYELEVAKNKKALPKDTKVSVIFDGTSFVGELLVVLVRYVIGFVPTQRLIGVGHYDKSLNSKTLAKKLNDSIIAVGLNGEDIISSVHDSASVNTAAVGVYERSCFSSTFSL